MTTDLHFTIKEDKIYMICPYSGKECNDFACGRVTTKICIKPSPIEPEENKTMKECITEVRIMIAKIHDDIEGRYDLDSYDKSIIQSMLCGIISDKGKPVELAKAKELLNDFIDEFDERIIGNWKLREKVKSFLSEVIYTQKDGWIETEKQRPKIGDNVEYSEDGITVEGTMDYTDRRTCMMAGIAGGFGYFGEGFATDGENGCDRGLICDDPKYWRLSEK